jgi:hypothetical protein
MRDTVVLSRQLKIWMEIIEWSLAGKLRENSEEGINFLNRRKISVQVENMAF